MLPDLRLRPQLEIQLQLQALKPGSNFKAKEGTKGTSRLVGVAVRVSEICALKEKYVLIFYGKIISKLNSSSNFQ